MTINTKENLLGLMSWLKEFRRQLDLLFMVFDEEGVLNIEQQITLGLVPAKKRKAMQKNHSKLGYLLGTLEARRRHIQNNNKRKVKYTKKNGEAENTKKISSLPDN